MKSSLLSIVIFLLCSSAFAQHPTMEKHNYIGVLKCKVCHAGEKHGFIFETWKDGPHGGAYESLMTPKAFKAAEGRDSKTMAMPQEAPQCLKCHVTGYTGTSMTNGFVEPKDGVTCESCHGPGSNYSKWDIMTNREKAVLQGLTEKVRTTCVQCHNEESPFYKPFDFDKSWAKIMHSRLSVTKPRKTDTTHDH